MKLSNESRLDELMKFKKDFNEKLHKAYKIYEQRSKTFSSNNNTNENSKERFLNNKTRNLPKIREGKKSKIFKSAFAQDGEIDPIKIKKCGRSQLKIMSNTWKPQYMVCDYFERFKRLKPNYEMTNWELVIIFLFIYFLLYRQEFVYVKKHIIKKKIYQLGIL